MTWSDSMSLAIELHFFKTKKNIVSCLQRLKFKIFPNIKAIVSFYWPQKSESSRNPYTTARHFSPQPPLSVQSPLPFVLLRLLENQNPSFSLTQVSVTKPIHNHLSSTQLPSFGSLTSLPLKTARPQLIQVWTSLSSQTLYYVVVLFWFALYFCY